jgi:deazaflavin-dependent oxidoreductase (nitroreductase family)
MEVGVAPRPGRMLHTPSYTPAQMSRLRGVFHAMNHLMVWMWKAGLGKSINSWPAVFGRILVIRHKGRKSGKEYLTPVNYADVDGEIFCTAGFGPATDWYRNILASPCAAVWLPEGWRQVHAVDETNSPRRAELLRNIIIASGMAGPLLGVDQRKLSDDQLLEIAKDYRIVHFQLEG